MSDTTDRLTLMFGRNSFPDDVKAVWGARLIWPNDLLFDRQDLQSRSSDDKEKLIDWLNGPNNGDGAIKYMKEVLTVPASVGLSYSGDQEAVIYEDEKGIIVGSAQSSHGYVYVCGYLK